MNKSILVFGPQGCGKTTNSHKLAQHFGLTKIVDNWLPEMPFPQFTTLVLTTWMPPDHELNRRVYSFENAMKEMKGAQSCSAIR